MTEANRSPSDNLQQLVAKFDREQAYRPLSGWLGRAVSLLAIGFTLYQLVTTILPPPPAQIHRALHLGFGLCLIFLLFSPTRRRTTAGVSVADAFWPSWAWPSGGIGSSPSTGLSSGPAT